MAYAVAMTYDAGLDHMLVKWGMSLAHIARVTKLPISRVRHWRTGGEPAAPPIETRNRLDEFDRLLRSLQDAGAEEPIYQLERRLVAGYTVVGWDLYDEGEFEALGQIAAGTNPVHVLDLAIRDWRDRFGTQFEVFEDTDGIPSIRFKQ